MDVRVLGTLEVILADGTRVALGGLKQRTVLALLAQTAGRRVSVDELILGVYGDESRGGARRTVQTYVSNLRHELGAAIHGTGDGYVLDIDPTAIDADRAEVTYDAAIRELEHEPDRAAARLRDALALWRGHPYADVEGHGALDAEIARLQELRLAVVERRIEADLMLGRHRELAGELKALTAEHPFRESLRAHQLVALYRAGRQSDALAALETTRRTLADELGIDPSPELQQLGQRILVQDPGLDVKVRPHVERRAVLVAELDAETWTAGRRASTLARRDEMLAAPVGRGQARIVGLRGTAVFVAFSDVSIAVHTGAELAGLGDEPTLRLAVDHGDVEVGAEAVTGPPFNRVARLVALAHPGQVLLSAEAQQALSASGVAGWGAIALGHHTVVGLDEPLVLYQLHGEGLASSFPPLRTDRIPPPVPRTAPASMPGYELRARLGVSELGAVYQAYQASVGREVVVRAIRGELGADPGFIRRFEAEGQRISRLAHPHVLPLLDYWRAPDGAYLVQPLIAGGDLRRRLLRDGVGREAALSLLDQVAAALAHAHDRGVAHGRLHPGNVLVDDAGNAYVADFGIAHMCEGRVGSSVHAYAAPEMLGGGPLTPAADVYALGVLAFELVDGGAPPLDGPLPLSEGAAGEVLARATSPDPGGRYDGPPAMVAALRSALTGVASIPALLSAARNPFKGLEPFVEADAVDFHGREPLVGELVGMLTQRRLLAVVGPSGIGKSSVVRAGLIPALRGGAIDGSETWLVTDLFPGAHPFEELASALQRVAVDTLPDLVGELRSSQDALVRCARSMLAPGCQLLLVVDQFEELFTQVADEDTTRRFLALLAGAAEDRSAAVRIVVTVRADFLDRPLQHAGFGEVLRAGLVAVRAPNRSELARAIREPAAGVGVAVEDRLIDRLVGDADGEPGALPLVQHVLAEAFGTRDSDLLTLAAYEESGGLRGAVGRKAEALYLGLTSRQRDTVRNVFLRLVTVAHDDQDTRRRVPLTELRRLGIDRGDLERVVDVFGRHRLLTFDRDPVTRGPTVEVAHEALLTDWDRLAGWVDTTRDELLTRRRITTSTQDWEQSGHDPSDLLRGGRLEAAEAWLNTSALPLTAEESRYLAASRDAADAEAARSRGRRRRTVAILAAALAVTLVFSAVAVAQRERAQEQTLLTRARELASDALLAIEADPERSILLSLEAVDTHRDRDGRPIPEAVSALQAALQASRVELNLPDGFESLAMSPGGQLLATDALEAPTTVRLVDLATGDVRSQPVRGAVGFDAMTFHPDGTMLAVGYEDTDGQPAVETFEVDTWRRDGTYDGPSGTYGLVQFTDDGHHLVATTLEGELVAWETATGARTVAATSGVGWLDIMPGTSLAAVLEGDDQVTFVDVRTGETRDVLETPGSVGHSLAVDPQGRLVAIALDRSVEVWDLDAGDLVGSYDNPSATGGLAWSADGRLAHLSNDGSVRIVDLAGQQRELVLRGHGDGVTAAAFTPDSTTLASVSFAGETRTWNVTTEGPAELGNLSVPDGLIWEFTPSPHDSSVAITTTLPNNTQRIDLIGPDATQRSTLLDGIPKPGRRHNAVVAADLSTAAALDEDLRGHVYDLPSARPRLTLRPCQSPVTISGDGSRLVVDGRLLCTNVAGHDPAALSPPADAVLRSAVIDAHTGEVVRDLGEQVLNEAALGPPGTSADGLAAVSIEWETIELHDLDNDRLVGTIDLRPDSSTLMWFSDDGRHLAFGTQSGLVTVLDITAVQANKPLEEAVSWRFEEASASVVSGTRIAADRLATSTFAGHVRVYTLADRRLEVDLTVDALDPVAVGFSADASHLLYEDGGRVIRRYELDLDRLMALAHSRLTRNLTLEECDQYRLTPCPTTTTAGAR